MYDFHDIIQIIYFIEFLDENDVENFIKFIFGEENAYIKPFKTYKEFLLYLLLRDKSEVNCKISNSIKNLESKVLEYTRVLTSAIRSFENGDNKYLKKIANHITNNIINCGYCYIIKYILDRDILCEIYKSNFYPLSYESVTKDEVYYIKRDVSGLSIRNKEQKYDISLKMNYYNLIFYERNYQGCKGLYTALDKVLAKYNKKSKKKYCHICNPDESLIKNGETGLKCGNCDAIFNLIHALDKTKETNDILSIIKNHTYNKNLTYTKKREIYYCRLKKYIKKMRKNVTISTEQDTEKIELLNELEIQVDKTFEDLSAQNIEK